MRTKLVAGNWKMNPTSMEGAALVEAFIKQIENLWDLDVVVCPPYLAIPRVRELLKNTQVKVGAQDCFWQESGAFTGKVSARMLHEFCCDYCIVGHSETRGRFGSTDLTKSTLGYFAETDETVNLKIKSLLYYSINPILCVGETADERAAGKTDEVVAKQLKGALKGVDGAEMYSMVVAYEPVWAIGTGDVCGAGEAERVCAVIRATIGDITDDDVADSVRILYGGSVKPDNSRELFAQPNIDGGLVGGASLDADGFARIVLSA
ncbi:MAG TPA: triose-phosphate isomerase [Fimbriimonadaceae bacterium]|nr:triose-phosphate isomerase [Fimbriimonadaceae bacterium]